MKLVSSTSVAMAVPLAAVLAGASTASAAEVRLEDRWPGWRGDGQGVARATRLPLEWTASRNVAWKTSVPGRGHSSPIVWGDRLFLTTAMEGEPVPGAKAVKHVAEGQVTTPLVGDGVVVLSSGYPSKVSIAVQPGGFGDITGETHVFAIGAPAGS